MRYLIQTKVTGSRCGFTNVEETRDRAHATARVAFYRSHGFTARAVAA